MVTESATSGGSVFRWMQLHWREALIVVLFALVMLATGADLWRIWQTDESMGHAPLVPAIVLFLLWQRKGELREWVSASPAGAGLLAISVFLYLAANWGDIEFLKPLSCIGVAFGIFWFLGGRQVIAKSAGALGFLLFTIPWPTTLTGKIQFPLQMASSVTAAAFAALLRIPVHRDGVTLSILPDPSRPPTYVILVAQQCSGLTSLIVLLALGYLIAYHTPASWLKRAFLFGITIPLALIANAIRLTFILAAGASHGAAVAHWVHDHEQPVLIFVCTIALMGIRALLLRRKPSSAPPDGGEPDKAVLARTAKERMSKLWHVRMTLTIAMLTIALAGSAYLRRPEEPVAQSDYLVGLDVPYRDWSSERLSLNANELAQLQPDAQLLRRYKSHQNEVLDLAVIAGHRKKTIHTPDVCLAGGGWDTITQHEVSLQVDGRSVPAVRALLIGNRTKMIATYFFTDGRFCTRSLPQFQLIQIMKRFGGRRDGGAMIRILASVNGSAEAAEQRSDDFARATLPTILRAIRSPHPPEVSP